MCALNGGGSRAPAKIAMSAFYGDILELKLTIKRVFINLYFYFRISLRAYACRGVLLVEWRNYHESSRVMQKENSCWWIFYKAWLSTSIFHLLSPTNSSIKISASFVGSYFPTNDFQTFRTIFKFQVIGLLKHKTLEKVRPNCSIIIWL